MKRILIICLILLWGVDSGACEFGKTYKDFYNKSDSYDLSVADDGGAYYFPNGDVLQAKKGTIWERVHFDKNGQIAIKTDYSFDGWHFIEKRFPPKNAPIPYVVYKGHRWYPQYHGIIYVYKDGREVK